MSFGAVYDLPVLHPVSIARTNNLPGLVDSANRRSQDKRIVAAKNHADNIALLRVGWRKTDTTMTRREEATADQKLSALLYAYMPVRFHIVRRLEPSRSG